MSKVETQDNEAEHRYEITVDGELAGFAEYKGAPGQRTFVHTVVFDEFEGEGVGSQLAKAALDDARQKELTVVPVCSFIRSYIERHPEYQDLVGNH